MKQLMPFLPAPGSVIANRIVGWPIAAVEMNCLDPVSTYPSPSRTARVRSADASDPAPGSVSAKEPIAAPAAIGRSHCSRCASVP